MWDLRLVARYEATVAIMLPDVCSFTIALFEVHALELI